MQGLKSNTNIWHSESKVEIPVASKAFIYL